MTTTIDGKLKRPVVRLEPMFYENVSREKKRPAMLAPFISKQGNSIWNMLVEKQDLHYQKLR